MNIAAVVVFTVTTLATSETTTTPVSKRAVQAALHLFGDSIRTPIGVNGEGYSARTAYEGSLPNLDAPEATQSPAEFAKFHASCHGWVRLHSSYIQTAIYIYKD